MFPPRPPRPQRQGKLPRRVLTGCRDGVTRNPLIIARRRQTINTGSGRQVSSKDRQNLPPRALVALALLCTLAAPVAAGRAQMWEAPLDTLEMAETPPAWIPQDLQISRKVLPVVSATTLPAAAAPARPPRLDDPLGAAQQFHLARRSLAAGAGDAALAQVREAVRRDPGEAAYAWWLAWRALRAWDLEFIEAVPRAVRATHADLTTWKRLQLLGHQASLLWLALFWTLVTAAYLFRFGGHLKHDLSALLLRSPRHSPRRWTLPALLAALLLLRPGWLALLATISIPLLLYARPRARLLLSGVWLATAAALLPVWPALRTALPAVDPASETVLLLRADVQPPTAATIRALEQRLAEAGDDPARTARLRLALGIQATRAGDYDAGRRLFTAILAQGRGNVAALVNLANNEYYLGRYDVAVEGYREASRLAPESGAIQHNLAQAYNKKLFFKESTEALARAAQLGFAAPAWDDATGEANGFAPVVYLSHDRGDLEACARAEAARYPALAHVAAWTPWLGERFSWLWLQLLLLWALAVAAILRLPAARRSRVCTNCSTVICGVCGHARGDDELCDACNGTAARARSELVLATLLKNRSRDQELAFIARARRFNRLLPGASNLIAGKPLLGLARLTLLATAWALIAFGWAFNLMSAWDLPGLLLPEETVSPLLLPLPIHAWSGPTGWSLVAGAVLLGLLYLTTYAGHESFRRGRSAGQPRAMYRVEEQQARREAGGFR